MRKNISATETEDMFVDQSLRPSTKTNTDMYQMSNISTPHENDVLMGRGGKNNQHCGNEKLRGVARGRCDDYCKASKKGKSLISKELVQIVRNMSPPGRFLRKDADSCKWEDVGDDIAREKTSQVLRDAVSQQSSPLAKSIMNKSLKKASSRKAGSKSLHGRNNAVPSQAPDQFSSADAQISRDYREVRSDEPYPPPYDSYLRGMCDNPTYGAAAATPSYPPVTPASATGARKRARYYESPLAVYDHRMYRSTAPSNTPPSGPLFSPPSRKPMAQGHHRSSPPAHFFRPSRFSINASPGFGSRSHFVPMSAQNPGPDPWVADIPAFADPSDFELFNGELLSDHSDHGEGAISPFMCP